MKVILTKKVPSLGNIGEVANVSQGFGRNFLFPNGLAVLADESNKKQLENEKKRLAKKVEEVRGHALVLKKQIEDISIELVRKVGPNGRLFGMVTTAELSKILEEKGIHVEKRLITVSSPIKALGNFKATVKLFSDVEGTFKIKVVMDPEQAKEMKEREAEAIKAKAKKKAEKPAEATEEKAPQTEEERLREEAEKIIG
jgi:large subunit ribosomal protein L9